MDLYNKLSDDVLVDMLKQQDKQAFTELYNRYWGVMFNHARRLVKDDDLAGDTVQEIFFNLWERTFEDLIISKSFTAYIYGALRYKIINHIEKRRVREQYMGKLEQWLERSHDDVQKSIEFKELEEIIESEIDNLPPKMRQIFLLSRNACLSYKEIAEKIDISEGTVRKQIYNALKILKSKVLVSFFLMIMKFIWWICCP